MVAGGVAAAFARGDPDADSLGGRRTGRKVCRDRAPRGRASAARCIGDLSGCGPSRAVGAAGSVRSSIARLPRIAITCEAMTETAQAWHKLHDFEDIRYERTDDGIAKITINRPEVRNSFRPKTVSELKVAFDM